MRAVLLILIVIIVALVIAVATGFLNITQVRPAKAPEVSATGNGVTARGGQAPAFDVETGSVKVGSKAATVKVPTIQVTQSGNEATPATNNAM